MLLQVVLSYIGTDGIRGIFGEGFFTEDFFLSLGWAMKKLFSFLGKKPSFLIGYDTRKNSTLLANLLLRSLENHGFPTSICGLCSSPEMSFETYKKKSFGLMITASHNPWPYNGIKFFTPQGKKWPFDLLAALDHLIGQENEENCQYLFRVDLFSSLAAPRDFLPFSSHKTYNEFLGHHGGNLKGLKVVLDGAHGAFYEKAPEIFRQRGAEVLYALGNSPDGVNINHQCGSLHPEALQNAVVYHGAHVGFAFDGDGDRVLAVDHEGNLYDGGHLMALFSFLFPQGGLVGTIMTNGALEEFCQRLHRPFCRTQVGDHHIAEALEDSQWIFGGEPSGHLLFPTLAPTADGLLTALCLCSLMKKYNLPALVHDVYEKNDKIPFHYEKLLEKRHYKLSSMAPEHYLCVPFENFPSLVKNYSITPRERCILEPFLPNLMDKAHECLGLSSRIVLRFSGTEPVLRLFMEGPSLEKLHYGQEILDCSIGKILN